ARPLCDPAGGVAGHAAGDAPAASLSVVLVNRMPSWAWELPPPVTRLPVGWRGGFSLYSVKCTPADEKVLPTKTLSRALPMIRAVLPTKVLPSKRLKLESLR